MKYILLAISTLICYSASSNTIDSLTAILNTSPDSVKIIIYQELIKEYQDVDFSQSIKIGEEAMEMATQSQNEIWEAKVYIALANVYHKKSNYDSAIDYYLKAREKVANSDDTTTILTIYNNLGTTYTDKGEYAKSQELLFEGLRIAEEVNSLGNIARLTNNIGLNYYYQEEFETALEFYEKSLTIRIQLNDKNGIALAYNNIGIIYYFMGDLEKVVDYFHKALFIYEEMGDLRGQSLPLYNIAEIYFEQKRYKDALKYYNKSLEIDKKVEEKSSIAMSYYSIGNVYVAMNEYDKAIEKQKEAIKIAKEIKANPILKEGYLHLANTYEKAGNYKESLKFYKFYTSIKDSIYNTEKLAQIAEMKSKYEAEKQQEQIELLEKEQALKDLEINRNEEKIRNQRMLLLASFLGIFSVIVFAIVLYRQIHQKQLINNLLEEKNTELDLQNKKLEQANIEIKRAANQKEKFFANTSHELRNPLNVVIGFTNLLLKTDLSEKQKKYLDNIKKSGNNLLVVINDLLTHSKIEAGKLKLEYVDFDIIKEVKNQIEFIKEKAFQKKIKVQSSIPQNIPQFVNGDPVRFAQIVGNLLSNAIKFTDFNGTIQINLKLLENNEGRTNIEFSVIDNGIGIEQDKLNEIFESFTQANFDTTRKFGGTGLGLAIVKSLVELQGGTISVDSQIDKGSVFTFNIVFNTCATPLENKLEKGTSAVHLQSALRILIVEDDPVNITLAHDTFTMFDANIEIDSALNGKIAIEKIKLHDYDIIVMDIQMPVMDGYQATKFIRNNLPSPKNEIPILGMSAYAMKEEVDLCFKYGMNDYITKPFSPEELLTKLTTITTKEFKKIKPAELNSGIGSYPKTLLQIYGNDTGKINRIIQTYLNEIPKKIDHLALAVNENNSDKVKAISHTLKTSFNLIENSLAAAICLDIETNLAEIENKKGLVSELKDQWEKHSVYLKKLIETKKPPHNEMA